MAWLGRLLTCALLVLIGAGHALPGLHHLMVEHVVCAEHGELTHAEHDAVPASRLERATSNDVTGATAEQVPAAEHAHEHCATSTSATTPSLAATESRAAEFARARIDASACPHAERSHSSLELLAFAPKLAPPV
jgi:hypothetical protein